MTPSSLLRAVAVAATLTAAGPLHAATPTSWEIDEAEVGRLKRLEASLGSRIDGIAAARATGDLDCDGVRSTFERSGVVHGGQVVGGGGLFKQDELE